MAEVLDRLVLPCALEGDNTSSRHRLEVASKGGYSLADLVEKLAGRPPPRPGAKVTGEEVS